MATERFELIFSQRGGREVKRDIEQIGAAANSVRSTLQFLRNALVVIAAARTLKGLTDQLDIYTLMRNRLRGVTNSVEELNAVQQELFRISQETGTSFETNGILFSRFAAATTHLKLTFKDTLDIIRGLNQLIALSGTDAQEASNSIRQFTQALGSPALQGDELRSVVENFQQLARIIARSKGVTGGSLIAFAKANIGGLTIPEVVKELQKALPEIDEQFQKSTRTIQQSLLRIQNAFILVTGRLADTTGAGKLLTETLDAVADNMDKVLLAALALGGIVAFNFLIAQVATLNTTLLFLGTKSLRAVQIGILALISPFRVLTLAASGFTAVMTAYNVVNSRILRSFGLLAGGGVGAFKLIQAAGVGAFAAIGRAIVSFNVLMTLAGGGFRGFLAIISAFATRGAAAILALLNPVKLLVGAFTLLRTVILTNPLFLAGAAVLAGGFLLFKVFEKELGGLVDFAKEKFGELSGFFENLLKGDQVKGLIDLLSGRPPEESGKPFEKVEELKGRLRSLFANLSPLVEFRFGIEDLEKALSQAQKAGIDFFEEFGLSAEELQRRQVRALAGIGNAATDYEEKLQLIGAAHKSGAASALEASVAEGKLGQAFSSASDSVLDSLDPLRAYNNELQRTNLILLEAQANGVQGVNADTRSEALTRVSRNLVGVGNATFEYQQQIKALDKALEVGDIRIDEYGRRLRELNEQFTSGTRSILASIDPLEEFNQRIGQAQDTLAREAEITGLTAEQQSETLRRLERNLLGVGNSAEEFAAKQNVLNSALQRGVINLTEYEDKLREARIESLQNTNTISAGLERGFLKFETDVANAAQGAEDLLTKAFESAEDAAVNFFQGTKGGLDDLGRELSAFFIRLATRQALTAGGNLFGVGQGASGGGFGFGQLFSGILGGGSGGGGAGFGLFSGLGSLFGFANGGDFTVGPNSAVAAIPGIDNRLVAFRAQDGERVSVTPKNGGSSGRPVQVIFNVSTPDADSFNRSSGQLMARAQAALARANARNN